MPFGSALRQPQQLHVNVEVNRKCALCQCAKLLSICTGCLFQLKRYRVSTWFSELDSFMYTQSHLHHTQEDLELMQFGTLKMLLAQQLHSESDLQVNISMYGRKRN